MTEGEGRGRLPCSAMPPGQRSLMGKGESARRGSDMVRLLIEASARLADLKVVRMTRMRRRMPDDEC